MSDIDDSERLIRRILRGGRTKIGTVAPVMFKLRPGETYLSMYRATLCTADDVCNAYAKGGAGAVSYVCGDLRERQFRVEAKPDPDDPVLGHAHAGATPGAYDQDGQVPLPLRHWLSEHATWEIVPAS